MKGGIGIPRSISRGYGKTELRKGITARGTVETEKDGYISKILKYIPAEVVATYVFLDGLLRGTPNTGIYWLIIVVSAIAAPLYMLVSNHNDKDSKGFFGVSVPDWFNVVVSPFAFVVWVLALGGPFVSFPWYSPLLGSIVLALFTLAIPAVDNLIAEKWKPEQQPIVARHPSKPRK